MHPDDLDGIGVSWTPVERAVEACRFCLSPTLQGKGRAKAFFLGGIELLREQGVQAMRYLCAKDNAAAYRIYTGVGHRQLEDTEQHGIEMCIRDSSTLASSALAAAKLAQKNTRMQMRTSA